MIKKISIYNLCPEIILLIISNLYFCNLQIWIVYLQQQILIESQKLQTPQKISIMRRKSDFSCALDQMFGDDEKKRISAIKLIRQIGAAIGPVRVRNQLVPFLNQFLDDDVNIMMALLQELQNFSPLVGGSEHQKILLPVLINFCLLDEKEIAMKSLSIIEQIISKHTDAYLDTVKKLCKMDMSISKQCGVILIGNNIKKVPHLQATLLQSYKSIVFSQNPSFRIIAAKHLRKIAQNVSNKEQICKIIDIIFNDSQDLPKLWVIDSLLLLYAVNSTFVVNKLKTLICIGTWRVNLRLCQYSNEFCKYMNKVHFKALIQPSFLKMLNSEDNQIRAAACSTLISLAKNMTNEQNFGKLYPILLKLSDQKISFVKNEFAKNYIKVFPYFSSEKIKQCLIPIVIKLLKQNNLEVSTGLLSDFQQLSKHLKNDKFEQTILKPLANQISTQNWRLSLQTLEILGNIVVNQGFYTNFIVQILLKQLRSKIEAVRLKATGIIINVIKNSPKQWCENQFLPQVIKAKDQPSYLLRQRVIAIINETTQYVSASVLSSYKRIISQMLVDRIPNIRMLALKCIYSNRKLLEKNIQSLICKLRDDNDLETKQIARQIKI